MGFVDTESLPTETQSASVRAENQPVQLLYQGESHGGRLEIQTVGELLTASPVKHGHHRSLDTHRVTMRDPQIGLNIFRKC